MAAGADFSFRQAVPADAREIARIGADGFATYRSFAPAGWEPPAAEEEIERGLPELLADPEAWWLVAERDGRMVAHVAIQPARTAIMPAEDGSLAHMRALFVDRGWWGCGLAGELHARALAEAAARGFTAIRLFTPAGQARARRFYEREGWTVAGEPVEAPFGLPVVEYRRAVV